LIGYAKKKEKKKGGRKNCFRLIVEKFNNIEKNMPGSMEHKTAQNPCVMKIPSYDDGMTISLYDKTDKYNLH
jgi:hypothetical protein